MPGGTGLCTNKKNGSCYFYGAGQDTGWWLSAYNVTTNTYALLNTMTGIQSNIVCSGGTGYNCAGGTFVWSTPGPAFSDIVAHDGVSLNCDFFIHGSKLNPAGDVMTTSGDTPILNPTACANVVNFWAWQPYKTPYDQFVNFQESGQGLNHFAIGNNTLFPLKSDYGSTLGVLLVRTRSAMSQGTMEVCLGVWTIASNELLDMVWWPEWSSADIQSAALRHQHCGAMPELADDRKQCVLNSDCHGDRKQYDCHLDLWGSVFELRLSSRSLYHGWRRLSGWL